MRKKLLNLPKQLWEVFRDLRVGLHNTQQIIGCDGVVKALVELVVCNRMQKTFSSCVNLVKRVDQRDKVMSRALCKLLGVIHEFNEIVEVTRALVLAREVRKNCNQSLRRKNVVFANHVGL